MKLLLCIGMCLLLMAGRTRADDGSANASKNPVSKLSKLSGPKPVGLLSDAEVAALQTEWTDAKTGAKFQFSASFSVPNLNASDKRKYEKKDQVPYRITCTLYEVKESGGRQLFKRQSGSAYIYVLDSEGALQEKKTVSLDKLCPS